MPMVTARGVEQQGVAVDIVTGRMAREIHEQREVRTKASKGSIAAATYSGALHCGGQTLSLPVLPHLRRHHPVEEVSVIRRHAQAWPMTIVP
jgi:hypothetical protein